MNVIAEDPPKLSTGADWSSAFKAETETEKTLARAVGEAYDWNFDQALETVRSLYGQAGADQELVVVAESAICAARAANRLDMWEGSDFGRATPWFRSIGDIPSAWISLEEREDGKTYIISRNDISIEYFNMIIQHSLKRLQRVSTAKGAEPAKAEPAAAGQPATRRESK
ncbi:MAG: hypothetical protein KDN18_03940 [Verrucomicrobiae bacterium]|nr:hypothetical protein [Verrucomicrobiae bacterium]